MAGSDRFITESCNCKKRVTLSIGDCHASREPVVIATLLGSCVAVCLFDPVSRVGGMNHILLPGRADLKNRNLPARFGIDAMELLIRSMMKLGADPGRMVAKVFGGASVIPGMIEEQAVGKKTAAFVTSFLEKERIRIMARDLGGVCVRNVLFYSATGDAWVKQSHSMKSSSLREEEQVLGLL